MKKLLKSLLALALVFALVAPTVLAEGDASEPVKPDAVKTATLKKVYTKEGEDAYFNDQTLTFSISNVIPVTGVVGLDAYEGVTGMLLFDNGEVTLTKDLKDADFTEGKFEMTNELKIDPSKATVPGIYGFEVKESVTDIDGGTPDENSVRKVYVVIGVDSEGKFEVSSIVAGDKEKADLNFNNKFETSFVTITKKTTGNQGDRNKEFPVEINVAGQENDKYTVYFDDNSNGIVYDSTMMPIKYNVKDGSKIVIKGLTKGDTYSIKETQLDGYTSSLGNNPKNQNESIEVSGLNNDYEVENSLNADIPTGVIETVAPFAVMMVLAIGFAVVYFRKRNIEA